MKTIEERKKYSKEWYNKNKDKVLLKLKEEYWRNPEKEREKARNRRKVMEEKKKREKEEFYLANKEAIDLKNKIDKEEREKRRREKSRALCRLWNKNNPNYRKEYRRKNKKYFSDYAKRYRKEKPEVIKRNNENHKPKAKEKYDSQPEKNKAKRKRDKERRRSNPNLRMQDLLGKRIRGLIKKNKGVKKCNTNTLIGCDVAFLKKHLESLFLPGMTWGNYGYRGWHIDHIKPCSKFDLTKEEDQKACFHYTNLQPLWGIDNMKKGNRYSE